MKIKKITACAFVLIAVILSLSMSACAKKTAERVALCQAKIAVSGGGYTVDESITFDFQSGDCLVLDDTKVIVSAFKVNANEQSYVIKNGVISFDFNVGKNKIDLSYIAVSDCENKIISLARVANKNGVSDFKTPAGYYSDYDLTLTAPLSYVVAAPFLTTARDTNDSEITYVYNANSVLSFTAVLSKNFIVSENKSGNKSIKRYILDENAENTPGNNTENNAESNAGKALENNKVDDEFIKTAFEFFETRLGTFPYDESVCVEIDCEKGFFSSGSAFVPEFCAEKRFAVVKSIARQWFCGKIRESDEFSSLGDFLTNYVSLVFFEEKGGETDKAFAKKQFDNRFISTKNYAEARRKSEKDYKPIVCRPAKDFSDKLEYAAVGVDGGVRAMLAVENTVGRKTLLKIIKSLLAANEKQTVDKQTFLNAFNAYPSCKRMVSAFLNGETKN